VARKYVKIDQEEELLEAFKILDKKKEGKIKCTELKHLICLFGE
jgi:Ca2+-binding EF-hand superfamily protein